MLYSRYIVNYKNFILGGVYIVSTVDYSVLIRTTGHAGKKYQALLTSISTLDPQPKEVIVVLPEGSDLPHERLGWERFFFAPIGMVSQRVAGAGLCKTQYALFCDDDISFDSDFVQQLYAPLREGFASFSVAPLYSFLPNKGPMAILCTLMASAMPALLHKKNRYISILKSTGYSYNRKLDVSANTNYETQSAPWCCFFADISAFCTLQLEKEVWLDAHGYAALDDQTMFYKAFLMGLKTVAVPHSSYVHLDAKTSALSGKPTALYSSTFNRVIFWHRFLYSRQKTSYSKLCTRLAFYYWILCAQLWNLISVLRRKLTPEDFHTLTNGLSDGWKYLDSAEYSSLPPF